MIPTGGGKTITALRIISKLLDIGVYGSRDRIIWTVHSKILKQQAYNELNSLENSKKFNFHRDILKVVEVRMKDDARRVLCEDECGVYKLLVIDEAHHSAANTYKDFFDKKIGILGLTATPTRNDDSELNFDRIAYSITFRELMDRGVVIKPDFINPDTKQTISVNSLDYADVETMERAYNTNTRNEIISNYLLLERKNLGFQKVIVFVPNNNHVDSLYNKLCEMNEIYGRHFYIGFIYGEKRNGRSNDKNIENDKYLEWHKKYNNPSILINCAMLNEGYDDKNIDAVVMAVPTRSLLYYMQCIGRVVRGSTTNNGGGKAYVIEFVDNLPNFVYRIDNKWLFSDISDYLEPKIIEKNYNSKKQFISKMKETLNSYNVVEEYRKYIPKNIDFRPISLLLLKPNLRPDLNLWIPLVLDSENRKKYTLIFNELNNNIKKYKDINN